MKIDDKIVKEDITQLKFSLIGKLTLVAEDSPYSQDDLFKKLAQVWGNDGLWRLIPLGRGYYNISSLPWMIKTEF